MDKGELLYICLKDKLWDDGVIGIFQREYEGDKDLSYHGSPWYERFVVCTDPKTGKETHYGNQTYAWIPVTAHIASITNKLKSIKKVVNSW